MDDQHIPQYKISVNNSLLKSENFAAENINVNLSCSQKANMCNITFACKYNADKSKVEDDAVKKLKPGAKISVQLGYTLPKEVFIGYINTSTVEFGKQGVVISVSCLDARGLLMGNDKWESFENKSTSQIVEGILKTVSDYTGGIEVKVSGAADKENPEIIKDMDYYDYLCSLAKRTKSSFCVIGTKLKFVSDIFTSARVSAEYKWGKDILKFKRTVDLSEQIGKVTVTGSEPETQKVFSASVSAAEVNGTGVKLNSCVKSKEINVESPNVHNQEEARKYAESIMKQHAYALVSGFATVIGNEKLTPGSKVKFSGLDSNLNGDFYIYSVDHSYSAGGFVSKIGFGGPSA